MFIVQCNTGQRREHSENTKRSLREHPENTERTLTSLAQRTHVPRHAVAIFSCPGSCLPTLGLTDSTLKFNRTEFPSMNKHLNSNRLCQFGLLLAIDSVSPCIRLTEECVALSCSCCCPEGHPDPAFVPCRLFSTFSIFSTACRCACKYLPFSVCPD